MFENFAFPSSPSSAPSSSSSLHPSSLSSRSVYVSQDYTTLTPPLSPLAVPSDTDLFASNPLCSTLSSLSLAKSHHCPSRESSLPPSPPVSDSDSESEKDPLSSVRGKRQAFARMQADEETVRSLGELVQRLCPSASDTRRKSSVVECGGVVKKRSRSRVGCRNERKARVWWEKAGRSVGSGLTCQNTRR